MTTIDKILITRTEPTDRHAMWALPGNEIISLKIFNNGRWMGTDAIIDLSPYLKKTDAARIYTTVETFNAFSTSVAETYQPKGNYALKSEIPSLEGYATEEWVNGLNLQPKNDETLETEDKTVIGAINEVNTTLDKYNYNIIEYGVTTYDELVEMAQNGKLCFLSAEGTFFYCQLSFTNQIINIVVVFSRASSTSDLITIVSTSMFDIDSRNIWPELMPYINIRVTKNINNISEDNNFAVPTTQTVKKYVTEQIAVKQNIITPGTGLAFDGDTLNVTLDTNVFFVTDATPETPTEEQKKKICLVPADTTEEGNYYTEYVWVVNEEHPDGYWEEFGTYKSEVDLTPYLKIEDAAATYLTKVDAADTYQPKGEYQPAGDYATNTALTEGLATKQPIGDYATNTELTQGLEDKQDKGDYALKSELPSYTTVPELTADYTVPANSTTREFIYQITVGATAYPILGAEGIKWANDVAPVVQANKTYVVSVVNNLAVWGEF